MIKGRLPQQAVEEMAAEIEALAVVVHWLTLVQVEGGEREPVGRQAWQLKQPLIRLHKALSRAVDEALEETARRLEIR